MQIIIAQSKLHVCILYSTTKSSVSKSPLVSSLWNLSFSLLLLHASFETKITSGNESGNHDDPSHFAYYKISWWNPRKGGKTKAQTSNFIWLFILVANLEIEIILLPKMNDQQGTFKKFSPEMKMKGRGKASQLPGTNNFLKTVIY